MKQKTTTAKSAAKTQPWHAVAIVGRGTCCAALDSYRGARFLSGQAPRLPLANCDRPQACACTYRHYPDRRTEQRRDSDAGAPMGSAKPAAEKRSSRGRRASDA
jgi:hypothetical protein